jgi:hypothetical protein
MFVQSCAFAAAVGSLPSMHIVTKPLPSHA